MLRRLVLPSLRQPLAAAAAAAAAAATAPLAAAAAPLSTTTAAPAAPVPGTSLRQAAFHIIHSAGPGQPLHNREVFRQLEAALPEDVSCGDRWMDGDMRQHAYTH